MRKYIIKNADGTENNSKKSNRERSGFNIFSEYVLAYSCPICTLCHNAWTDGW